MFVGSSVFVAGTGVLVEGGNGVCVGAFCVWAATVCVTMAWTVAKVSGVGACSERSNGLANKKRGRQATIAKTTEAKTIREI